MIIASTVEAVYGVYWRECGGQTHILKAPSEPSSFNPMFRAILSARQHLCLWLRDTSAAKIHSQEREAAQGGITKLHMLVPVTHQNPSLVLVVSTLLYPPIQFNGRLGRPTDASSPEDLEITVVSCSWSIFQTGTFGPFKFFLMFSVTCEFPSMTKMWLNVGLNWLLVLRPADLSFLVILNISNFLLGVVDP